MGDKEGVADVMARVVRPVLQRQTRDVDVSVAFVESRDSAAVRYVLTPTSMLVRKDLEMQAHTQDYVTAVERQRVGSDFHLRPTLVLSHVTLASRLPRWPVAQLFWYTTLGVFTFWLLYLVVTLT